MSLNPSEFYEVLTGRVSSDKPDETQPDKKIKLWIETRGGVNVWQNHDLSSSGAGQYTWSPAQPDEPTFDAGPYGRPSWRHQFVETVTDLSRFRFYHLVGRVHGIKLYSDTDQGWKAAYRAMDGLSQSSISGLVYHAHAVYTVERIQLESTLRRWWMVGNELTLPVITTYHVAVLEYSRIVEVVDGKCVECGAPSR